MRCFLDFEKAYDRVWWDYLFSVMVSFRGVQLLLKPSRVCLMFNGWTQALFEFMCGVKQGDPLSPLLFLLSLEPMCNLLRQRPEHSTTVLQQLGGVFCG